MGLQKGPIYLGEQFPEHRHGQMGGAFFLCDVQRHLLVPWFPFFVLFLGFGWLDHLHQDLLHQLGHSNPSKQRDIKIATGSSNRPPRGRSGRDLHCLHHTKNNTMPKIGDFCPVALSCKAHSNFMGDNLKERVQTEHCVGKRKKTGTPIHRISLFLRTFASPFTVSKAWP